jgi:cytochrome c oxidase subunit I+III
MVAIVPFDWQVHDTYFVVAHLHYVLIGGMVFPLFGAIYYWMPYCSKHALSERLGRWVFGLMFAGFNIAFFPMHVTGLIGMPRRVYTYDAALGWGTLNFISTVGAFMLAAGVALFVIDVARRFRMASEENAGNVWNAGTLEWLPNGNYSNRSIPIVTSRYPLWEQPGIERDVEEGAYYLPKSVTGERETIVTSPVDAKPQFLLRMPMPGWAPVIAAWFTAAFFLLLTFKLVVPALVAGVIAIGGIVYWGWELDPPADHPDVDIGGGIRLPVYMTGPTSQAWWAMVVLMLVGGTLYGCMLFSYLYLWTVSPEVWPQEPAAFTWALAAAGLLIASSVVVGLANRQVKRSGSCSFLLLALLLLIAGIGCNFVAHADVSPTDSAYGASVYMVLSLDAFFGVVVGGLALFALARQAAGLLDSARRVTFDNARVFWHYTVVQALVGLALTQGFPRLVG